MKVVGVTGGIGSGKSVVCKVFASLGVPVFEADREAKSLYRSDFILINQIREVFGNEVFNGGNLDRQKLAAIVFNSNPHLELLNGLVHPAVARRFEEWKNSLGNVDYVIKEAAILIETGGYKTCDKLILVTSPISLKLQRVMRRDHLNEPEVNSRMKRQWPDEKKMPFADIVIQNDDQHLIVPEILKFHQEMLTEIY